MTAEPAHAVAHGAGRAASPNYPSWPWHGSLVASVCSAGTTVLGAIAFTGSIAGLHAMASCTEFGRGGHSSTSSAGIADADVVAAE